MPDFLLEIGCEEIPARMIDAASLELRERVQQTAGAGTAAAAGALSYFDTPRRLAVIGAGHSCGTARCDRANHRAVGERCVQRWSTYARRACLRQKGRASTFCTLEKITTAKGEYLSAKVTKKGRSAAEILAEALPKEIDSIYWPKNMYWRKPSERFRAPGALAGGDARRRSRSAGIRRRAAGNESRGHRILSPGAVRFLERARLMWTRYAKPKCSAGRTRKADSQRVWTPPPVPSPARAGAKTKRCSIPS